MSSSRSAGRRIASLLLLTLLITGVGLGIAFLGSLVGWWAWPPRSSSPFGVATGFLLAAIVLFEMLILFRKRYRRYRLFRTKYWMRLHIFIGLLGLPVVLLHASFDFGGPIPMITMIFFLLVTFSGIWGLLLQQILPERILRDIPEETIASEIDGTAERLAESASQLIVGLTSVPVSDEVLRHVPNPELRDAIAKRRTALVEGSAQKSFLEFHEQLLVPFLLFGPRSASTLKSRTASIKAFQRLRGLAPEDAKDLIDRLESLRETRAQWDHLRRLNRWLHGWLLVHVPLSWAMSAFMVVHAVRALKYW